MFSMNRYISLLLYYLPKNALIYLLFSAFVFTVTPPAIAQDTTKAKTDSAQTIPDTLLFRIQKAQAAITEINATNKRGYGIDNIRSGLVDVQQDIAPVKKDMDVPRKVIDAKSLLSYNLILKDALGRLTDWRNTLTKYNNDLQRLANQVIELSNDSVLMITARDTTDKRLYTRQLTDIKLRLQSSGKVTTAKLDTVSRLLADVSASYL